MNTKTRLGIVIVLFLIVIVGIGAYIMHSTKSSISTAQSGKLQIIAAENFWGSIASQIGGDDVQVTSIVSDPNADPHEYEVSSSDAREFASANYVIVNGVGYDSWADKLLSASTNPNRKVLDVGTLVGKQEGDNPHLWYNPTYVNMAAKQMELDMIALDPSHTSDYEADYATLQTSLAVYQGRIASIAKQYGGTKVAATEDIFAYLASSTDLDLISPPTFTEAVAEGNDPPAQSVVEFQNQLQNKEVSVLVYNEQTVTPLTENMKKLAADEGIPVIGITETIQPPDTSFQDWMNAQLINLENALNANTLGQ
jgi:zinc/manganese transport system substrate-binding protein